MAASGPVCPRSPHSPTWSPPAAAHCCSASTKSPRSLLPSSSALSPQGSGRGLVRLRPAALSSSDWRTRDTGDPSPHRSEPQGRGPDDGGSRQARPTRGPRKRRLGPGQKTTGCRAPRAGVAWPGRARSPETRGRLASVAPVAWSVALWRRAARYRSHATHKRARTPPQETELGRRRGGR